MGPKPMASEDQTGFSPDDRNISNLITYGIVFFFGINQYYEYLINYLGLSSILYTIV